MRDRFKDILNNIEAAIPEATKKQSESKADLIPMPVIDPNTENTDPIWNTKLKPELKDQKTIDQETQKMRDQIKQLVPKNPNPEGYVVQIKEGTELTDAECHIKSGDMVRNINESCTHYGSEGVVNSVKKLPNEMGDIVLYKATNTGKNWDIGKILAKTPDQLEIIKAGFLNPSMQYFDKRQPLLSPDDVGLNDMIANDDEEEEPEEEPENDMEDESEDENEMDEYKQDFFEMSVGSLRAIATHAQEILNSLDKPNVKENLTESWLQGKIAITEDYMRTIHDFIMYVTEADDTISAADRPGLWENIRRKKEREGKNYKPAKPGDPDRPDKQQWKKLTK